MPRMGFTLNMMSMLALTISVGMIIDDTIVVLENSYRHMEEGKPRMQAAREAIAEIGFAVIATSLAIGAVFVPVAFMTGLVGRFFYEFGLTVAFAVAVSTFIAVTLSPMLCSRMLKVTTRARPGISHPGTVLHRPGSGLPCDTCAWPCEHRYLGPDRCGARVCRRLGDHAVHGQGVRPRGGRRPVQRPGGNADRHVDRSDRRGTGRNRATGAKLPGVTGTFTTIGAGMEGRVNVATMLTRLVPKAERDLGQQRRS